MKRGVFTIASHMTELAEELLNYHRDEDYKTQRPAQRAPRPAPDWAIFTGQ
jgi:hypothetical protein